MFDNFEGYQEPTVEKINKNWSRVLAEIDDELELHDDERHAVDGDLQPLADVRGVEHGAHSIARGARGSQRASPGPQRNSRGFAAVLREVPRRSSHSRRGDCLLSLKLGRPAHVTQTIMCRDSSPRADKCARYADPLS